MSSRNLWLAVVIALMVLIGGYYIIRKSYEAASISTQTPTTNTIATNSPEASSSTASPSASLSEAVIDVTSNGFSPGSVTMKAGGIVTWMNTDSAPHQVNSNPHPTHTDYPPLNTIGLLQPGQQKSLMFPTPGRYGFHDHLNPQYTGTVIVQ